MRFRKNTSGTVNLKKLSFLFSLVVVLALSANALFLLMIEQAYSSVVTAQEQRQRALSLSDQLRQETEQLTTLVRAYTSTGQTRYLIYYFDILAIRQGDKPEPENYTSGAYWDMAIAGDVTHKFPQNGEQRSVASRMKSLGFGDAEFKALSDVSATTEAMKQIEQIAFAATQGLYDPQTETFISDGTPDLAFASKQVHSQQYNQLKSHLAQAAKQLGSIVDQRTNTAVTQAEKELKRWIFLTFCSVILSVLMVLAASRLIRHRVLLPIERLSQSARRLAAGDYSARTSISAEATLPGASEKTDSTRGVEELIALGATFDSMAESIEQDIRLRQQVLRELEAANQKTADASRAKSMFLANMSHEIRTPMNAIIGMAYLAMETELTPRQHDYIHKVHSAATALLGIINDILDFSKVEAGKLELEQARFVLEDVVGNPLSLLRYRAQEKEIELLFDIDDPSLLGERGALLGDPLRLGQVLTNLLSNAVKFTHQGYVRLAVRVEERSADAVLLQFTLRDTGIGMSAEQISRLFQEFTQADGSTTRQYGGTGLGLTISRKLVELMDGHLWVDSVPGEGSSFIFTARFPIAKPVKQHALVIPGVDVLRVLVVDDQPAARLVLTNLLSALGVGAHATGRIDSAINGSIALRMIRQAIESGQAYDVVLVDWMMPGMNGGTMLQTLQDSELAQPPLTVVVSAYDSEMMHAATDRLGIRHFLAKPVLPDALRGLLNILTGNHTEEENERHALLPHPSLLGMRVLLVEDNPINQQLAVELMESRSIAVTVANNGQEALDRLSLVAADYFHLVLMDLQMPVMDGYEATRRLRADPRHFSLPIVAMTAHAMVEERQRCKVLGMNGHLSKPIAPDEFYATLARYYSVPPMTVMAHSDIVLAAPVIEPASLYSLPVISGLNTADGLRFCGDSEELYRQLLGMFANNYRNCHQQFDDYLTHMQWDDAMRLAHTIKGLSGTIGANTLILPASTLEAACKTRQTVSAHNALASLMTLMTPLLSALQQQVPTETIEQAASNETVAVTK